MYSLQSAVLICSWIFTPLKLWIFLCFIIIYKMFPNSFLKFSNMLYYFKYILIFLNSESHITILQLSLAIIHICLSLCFLFLSFLCLLHFSHCPQQLPLSFHVWSSHMKRQWLGSFWAQSPVKIFECISYSMPYVFINGSFWRKPGK